MAGAFGQLLHAAGVPATPERSGRFARAVALARPASVDEVYWLGRVTLLTAADQIRTYDAVFDQVFRGVADVADHRGGAEAPASPATPPGGRRPELPAGADAPAAGGAAPGVAPSARPAGDGPAGAEARLAAASADERLRTTDFAALTPEELERLRGLLAELAIAPPPRRTRRRIRHHQGRRPDLRATLRRAQRRSGDPVEWVMRRAKRRPRRLVLLADVSGSMEPYSRAYLHLLHGAVRAGRTAGGRAEAFVFATRLTRLTRALAGRDPDAALAQAAAAAPDWSGGTRIGEAVAAFNDRYGRRGLARGAVVVIVSDGWETGDAALLGEQMARLARLAHRVVWVNPRVARPGYEPRVAGMAAALPHVDALVSGHSLEALDELLGAIAGPD